jgi:hypothetical protein
VIVSVTLGQSLLMNAASLPDEAPREVKFEESASVPNTLPPLTLKTQPGTIVEFVEDDAGELGESNDAFGTVMGVALATSELKIRAEAIAKTRDKRRDTYDDWEESFMLKISA